MKIISAEAIPTHSSMLNETSSGFRRDDSVLTTYDCDKGRGANRPPGAFGEFCGLVSLVIEFKNR